MMGVDYILWNSPWSRRGPIIRCRRKATGIHDQLDRNAYRPFPQPLHNVQSATGSTVAAWHRPILRGKQLLDDINNPERLWEMSPVAHAKNAKTPLVLHGQSDGCPQEQGANVQAMRKIMCQQNDSILSKFAMDYLCQVITKPSSLMSKSYYRPVWGYSNNSVRSQTAEVDALCFTDWFQNCGWFWETQTYIS